MGTVLGVTGDTRVPLLLFLSFILGTATDSVYLVVAWEGRGREFNFSKQRYLTLLT